MRIFLSGEDEQAIKRTAHLRGGLVRRWHHVTTARRPGRHPDARTELWLHGLHHNRAVPTPDETLEALTEFPGTLVLFQSDDDLDFFVEKLPSALIDRTRLFLRNQWRVAPAPGDDRIRARRGYITPLVRRMPARPGQPLAERRRTAIFYGTRTGIPETGTSDARATLVRLMRASGLPFDGGLTPHKDYISLDELTVPRISTGAYQRRLETARIALAPWGNNPITYRLFEGLAARCLVLAMPLRSVDWPSGGLTPGVHYVELREDLGDLAEKVEHYLDRPEEAQAIADEGHRWCRARLSFPGAAFPDVWLDEVLATWGDVLTPAYPTFGAKLRALTVPLRPRM